MYTYSQIIRDIVTSVVHTYISPPYPILGLGMRYLALRSPLTNLSQVSLVYPSPSFPGLHTSLTQYPSPTLFFFMCPNHLVASFALTVFMMFNPSKCLNSIDDFLSFTDTKNKMSNKIITIPVLTNTFILQDETE